MVDNVSEATLRPAVRGSGDGFFKSLFFQQTLFLAAMLGAWELAGAYAFDPFWSSRPSA